MNILLIGATGQIGYTLTKTLVKTKHQVSVLVRNRSKLPLCDNSNVLEFKEFTPDAFKASLKGIDHVIYGVGLPEQFAKDGTIFDRINYGILKTFLDVFKESHPAKLTYISTYEVFRDVDNVIREFHQVADESRMTPYFKAMTKAYRLVTEFAKEKGTSLTTIHPAAVYGGLATGDGFTSYIENLLNRRFWRVPFVVEGRFPVVHVDSLADAVVRSLERPGGAYIVSDQMTTLREIALTLKKYSHSYVPTTMPLWAANFGASASEFTARLFRVRPIMAKVQLEFITKGLEPKSDRAQKELGWTPLSMDEGIKLYLEKRLSTA